MWFTLTIVLLLLVDIAFSWHGLRRERFVNVLVGQGRTSGKGLPDPYRYSYVMGGSLAVLGATILDALPFNPLGIVSVVPPGLWLFCVGTLYGSCFLGRHFLAPLLGLRAGRRRDRPGLGGPRSLTTSWGDVAVKHFLVHPCLTSILGAAGIGMWLSPEVVRYAIVAAADAYVGLISHGGYRHYRHKGVYHLLFPLHSLALKTDVRESRLVRDLRAWAMQDTTLHGRPRR